MNRAAKIAIGVVVVLLLLAATTYGWRSYSYNHKLDHLQAKAKEMMGQPRPAPGASNGGDRRGFEGFRALNKEVRELPEAYQQQFYRSMGNIRERREEQKLDEYLKLTKLERRKYLDKEIAEGEKRRKEWEARRKQREVESGNRSAGANGGGGGGPGGPPNATAGGPPRGDGNRGGWGGGRSMSARLDRTTPEQRAKMAEYRRDMENRRKELGLPADFWRGGRR